MNTSNNLSSFVITRAAPKDIEEIVKLDRALWGEWSNSFPLYRQVMDLFPELVFIARTQQGEYAGCAMGLARPRPSIGWVLSVDIALEFRRKGLGKKFLKTLLISFHDIGVESVTAMIEPNNEASRRLFSSCGFKNGELKLDYFGQGNHHEQWVFVREEIRL